MGQNIVELGFDIDRWGAEKKIIYEDLMSIYEIAKKVNDTKLLPGGGGGWAEMKAQVEALKSQVTQLQDANVKLAASMAEVTAAQAKEGAETKKTSEETRKATETTSKYVAGQKELLEIAAKNEIQSKKLTEEKKKLAAAFKAAEITETQYVARLAEIKEKQVQLSVSSQGLNVALKNIEKGAQATDGSLEKLRTELNLSLMTFDKMSASDRGGDIGKELEGKIQSLTKEISASEQATGRFQRNVGNYANSLAEGFENVRREISRLKQEQNDLSNLKSSDPTGFATRGGEEQLKRTTAALGQLENVERISLKTNTNLSGSVRDISKAYMTMAESGNFSKEFLNEFKKFTADSVDKVNDLKDEIRALSSDTRSFDLLSGSINVMASGFQIASGAAAMFGGSEEDVQKITMKLVAVQNIATGAREIANEATKRGSALNLAYVGIQNMVATAMDRSAAASVRLKASLGLLGIAVTVIGAIAIALSMMGKKATEAEIAQKNLNEAMKEAGKEYGTAIEQVNSLRTNIDLAKNKFLDKEAVVKQYNETMGKTTGEVKSLDEAEKALNKNADAYIQFMYLKAIATAAFAKASQLAVDKQLKLLEGPDKDEMFLASMLVGGKRAKELADKQQKEQSVLFDKQIDSLLALAKEKQGEAAKKAKEMGFDFFGTPDKKDKADKKDSATDMFKNEEEMRKALFEKQKVLFQERIDLNQKVLDDDKSTYFERIAAARNFTRESIALINAQKDFELGDLGKQQKEEERKAGKDIKDKKKRAEVLETIDKEYAAKRAVIEENTRIAIGKIKDGEIPRQKAIDKAAKELLKKNLDEKLKLEQEAAEHRNKVHDNEMTSIQNTYDAEIVKLEDKFARGLISEKNYNREKLRLKAELQAKQLEKEIEFLQQEIKIAKARAELEPDAAKKTAALDAIAAAEGKLAGLQNDLSALLVDIFKSNNDKTKKNFAETFNQIAEIAKKTLDIIGGFVDANITRQKNAIQELIDKNNEYSAAEIERITNSTLSEEEKAAKVIQLKAEQDAKNTEYARKQKELDMEAARFKKAAAIATIILNTAIAVTNAMTTGDPYTAGLRAAIVAAIGAAELAVAISTPIPSYAEGSDDTPGGISRYGEAGAEAVKEPGKPWRIVNKETIGYLAKHSKVVPLTADSINNAMYGSMMESTSDRLMLIEAIEKSGSNAWKQASDKIVGAIERNKNKTIVKNNINIGADFHLWVNKYVNGKA